MHPHEDDSKHPPAKAACGAPGPLLGAWDTSGRFSGMFHASVYWSLLHKVRGVYCGNATQAGMD